MSTTSKGPACLNSRDPKNHEAEVHKNLWQRIRAKADGEPERQLQLGRGLEKAKLEADTRKKEAEIAWFDDMLEQNNDDC